METKVRKVILKIHATQESDGEIEDVIELYTEGKFVNKEGRLYIIYKETELSGLEGCVTSIRIVGEEVKLRRYGMTPNPGIDFIPGRRHTGKYQTPLGPIDMEILTSKITNELKDDGTGGTVVVEYEISLKGIMEARNVLTIKVINPETETKLF